MSYISIDTEWTYNNSHTTPWVYHRFLAKHGTEIVGKLVVTYIPRNNASAWFATISQWRTLCNPVGTEMQYDDFLQYHVDRPTPDYVYVKPTWRRNGIGMMLYMEAARQLSDNGLYLYQSHTQSDDAIALWEKFRYMGMPTIDGRCYIDIAGITHGKCYNNWSVWDMREQHVA